MKNKLLLLIAGTLVSASGLLGACSTHVASTTAAKVTNAGPQPETAEKTISAQVVAGPFDIHRKYRSMEGPYVSESIKVADLVNGGKTILPESKVKFVEAVPIQMNGMMAKVDSADVKGTGREQEAAKDALLGERRQAASAGRKRQAAANR